MSHEIIKLKFKEELAALNKQLTDLNDGVTALKTLEKTLISHIKSVIHESNSTASIDERISILGAGHQKTAVILEKQASSLEESVLRLKDRIKYLLDFEKKIDFLIDEEKKSNAIIEKQEIQNEE